MIEATGLGKVFGALTAVHDLTFAVGDGETAAIRREGGRLQHPFKVAEALHHLEGRRVVDHHRTLLAPVSRPFWGPGGRPSLELADAHQPPLIARPEVVESATEPAERCTIGEEGRILLCSAARRLDDSVTAPLSRGRVASSVARGWVLCAD